MMLTPIFSLAILFIIEFMYKFFFKRLLSIVLAIIGLAVIGWFICIVAIVLHFTNKGAGAFFLQERPGKDTKLFKVIKFKTMTDERDENGNILPDEQRLTKVGKIVRSLSIDELPQLINILKGDMSFIGPRPLMPDYLKLYTPEQMRRHEVRPGITGWAQVNGRNAISFTERFKYDIYYIDHLSILLDIKIIYMTIVKVFKREGISAEGQATMEPFDGTN